MASVLPTDTAADALADLVDATGVSDVDDTEVEGAVGSRRIAEALAQRAEGDKASEVCRLY